MATFLLALLSLNLVAHDLESFRRAASEAKPGDQILLAPGTYRSMLHFSNLHGTEEEPIVLGVSDPANPPVIAGNVQISGRVACFRASVSMPNPVTDRPPIGMSTLRDDMPPNR
jgi:hypothetical protein